VTPAGLARQIGEQALLVAIAFGGGAVFAAIGVPAPWVSGSMIAVAIAAAIFRLPDMLPVMRDVAMVAAGIAMGVGVTPETLRIMAKFPLSFAALALAIVACTWLAARFLERAAGWNRTDALLASVPGALSVVYLVAAEKRADIVAIAVVQNLRLLALVALLPTFVTVFEAHHLPHVVESPISPRDLLIVGLAGLLVGSLFERVGMPAGLLAGGALAGMLLAGPGWIDGRVPEPIAIAGYVLIGVFTGLRMGMIDRRNLVRHFGAGMAALAISIGVALIVASAVSLGLGIRFGSSVLAFAPGGVEAMALLSLSLGLDPLFVTAHHLLRFISIGVLLPVFFRERSGG
jgi:hypothetical protein